MNKVDVHTALLAWACERCGKGVAGLSAAFPQLPAWLEGEAQPTLKQLQRFAQVTYTPMGYFFLSTPPLEQVPIPDFRTMAGAGISRPSPDLLDTIYICQQRQAWFRDYARRLHEAPVAWVGSVSLQHQVVETAHRIREALGFDVEARRRMGRWEDALRCLIGQIEEAGALVMCNGVVKNNNHRPLDPDEFRGFALVDDYAPLMFINGKDTKSGQMITLVHELAHLWLGQTGLSDIGPASEPGQGVERWCNAVAAEMLVPMEHFRANYRRDEALDEALPRLARIYKVSTLVILRRMLDAGGFSRQEFQHAYDEELHRLGRIRSSSSGNFYNTQGSRLSKRFASALISSTLEGGTLYKEAFNLLGLKKMSTFKDLGERLGVGV